MISADFGAEVIDLIQLHLLNNPDRVVAVGEIAVVQGEPRIQLVGILVEVINPRRVVREAGRRP